MSTVTREDRIAAARLAGWTDNSAEPQIAATPLEEGYLAAVERLEGAHWLCPVRWEDAIEDEGTASLAPHDRGMVLLNLETSEDTPGEASHVLAPEQARRRAFELLVLADIAERATGGQEQGR
jgi:hypothetical protein